LKQRESEKLTVFSFQGPIARIDTTLTLGPVNCATPEEVFSSGTLGIQAKSKWREWF